MEQPNDTATRWLIDILIDEYISLQQKSWYTHFVSSQFGVAWNCYKRVKRIYPVRSMSFEGSCSALMTTSHSANSFRCLNVRFTRSYWGNEKTLNPLKRKGKSISPSRTHKVTKTTIPLDKDPQALEEDHDDKNTHPSSGTRKGDVLFQGIHSTICW